jgi:hypothetical protein
MKALEKLNQHEKARLFETPAYVSLLAANADGEMDETEKTAAIHFSHVKTYSCDPLLTNFYKEVEKNFLTNIERIDIQLPKGKAEREEAINKELLNLEPIFSKLGDLYSNTLHRSFISYTKHVSEAHRSAFVSFIIPFDINGITT